MGSFATSGLGPLGVSTCCIGAGIVFELRVDALETRLDTELPEVSLEYPGLEATCGYIDATTCGYIDAMLGSGELPLFGNIKGVYSSDLPDEPRRCCVPI